MKKVQYGILEMPIHLSCILFVLAGYFLNGIRVYYMRSYTRQPLSAFLHHISSPTILYPDAHTHTHSSHSMESHQNQTGDYLVETRT